MFCLKQNAVKKIVTINFGCTSLRTKDILYRKVLWKTVIFDEPMCFVVQELLALRDQCIVWSTSSAFFPIMIINILGDINRDWGFQCFRACTIYIIRHCIIRQRAILPQPKNTFSGCGSWNKINAFCFGGCC